MVKVVGLFILVAVMFGIGYVVGRCKGEER